MIFAILIGIPLGFFAAKRHGGAFDHASLVVSLIGISIPIFFLALILKYIFAVRARLVAERRPAGRADRRRAPDELLRPRRDHHRQLERVLGRDQAPDPARDRARLDPARDHRAHHARLGARRPERGLRAHRAREGDLRRARSTAGTCCATRCSRSRRSSACRSGCCSRARSSPRRSSRVPGIGTWLAEAIFNRDYPVIQGGILFVAIVFVLVNLLVDISYGAHQPADPAGGR